MTQAQDPPTASAAENGEAPIAGTEETSDRPVDKATVAPTTEGGSVRAAWLRRGAVGALVFGLVGLLAAAGFGISLLLAATSDEGDLSRERDAVQQNAEQAAVALATIDPRDVQAGLDRWERTTTGPLLAELRRGRDAFAKTIAAAKRSTEANVLASAVRDLDVENGTAAVLVAMDVTTNVLEKGGSDKKGGPGSGETVRTPQRLELVMSRAGDVWKASGVRMIGHGG